MLDKILENAKLWAREAGRIQLEKLEKEVKFSSKSTDIDMVTEVDVLSEKTLIGRIREAYPEHSILSEEEGVIGGGGDYTWILDPLDGTTNYLHGFPMFAVSMALKHKEETVLGVVYVPRLDEMFHALRGGGAFLNGKRIHVSDRQELKSSVLATGFPYDRAVSEENNVNIFNSLIRDVRGMRRTGCAAFDLCCAACGRFDGFWEIKLSLWDIGAGELIIREAGGEVVLSSMKKTSGEDGVNIIAGNPAIVGILRERIDSVGKYF